VLTVAHAERVAVDFLAHALKGLINLQLRFG
jgi:hypothetical protein